MNKYLIYDFSDYGFAREPVIRKLKSGMLVCSFLTGGTTEPQNANVVMLSKSSDGGKTWTNPCVAVSHSERGCWATEIFTETEKPFIAVHTYNTNDWKREHYRELQTFRAEISDSGEVGEPTSFKGLNGVSVRQGITMSNGEKLFPVYWQEVCYDFDWSVNSKEAHGNKERYPFRCGVAVCNENGIFSRFGYLFNENHLWENNVVELENGHLLMLMRSGGENRLFKSESFDFGRTWSKAVKTDILNAHTKIALFKIGKEIFLVNNFVDANGIKNRTNLQIKKSTDGINWSFVANVEEENEVFFYPHACVDTENKTVYIAYENAKKHFVSVWDFDELT